jgi:hypothetical protein
MGLRSCDRTNSVRNFPSEREQKVFWPVHWVRYAAVSRHVHNRHFLAVFVLPSNFKFGMATLGEIANANTPNRLNERHHRGNAGRCRVAGFAAGAGVRRAE